ncbi:MAG: TlpA disulfide reductase family protein [Anaerolineales bacterium]
MSGIWLVSFAALWILFGVMAIVLLGLVRQIGLIQLRLGPESELLSTKEGLQYGTNAPNFEARDLLDGKRNFGLQTLKGKPIILVFFSPSCSACLELAPHLADFHRSFKGKVNVALISRSSPRSILETVATFKLKMPVAADEAGSISRDYMVRATPFAYRMDAMGIVRRRGIVNTFDDLEGLLIDAEQDEPSISLPG